MASRSKKSKLIIGLSTAGFVGLLAATAYSVEGLRDVTFLEGTFGTLDKGDNTASGPVDLGFNAPFFGPAPSTIYVNNNGNVSFGAANPSIDISQTGPETPATIAPFFADVDTSGENNGSVEFGQAIVDGKQAFVVNWNGVGAAGGGDGSPKNSFQLVLKDNGDGTLGVEFNYGGMGWTTGGSSGGDENGQPDPEQTSVPPFIGVIPGDPDGDGPEEADPPIIIVSNDDPTNLLDPDPEEGCTPQSTALSCIDPIVFDVDENGDPQPQQDEESPVLLVEQPNGDEVNLDALTSVPEPATLALFGAGLVGLGFMRRRRR